MNDNLSSEQMIDHVAIESYRHWYQLDLRRPCVCGKRMGRRYDPSYGCMEQLARLQNHLKSLSHNELKDHYMITVMGR